MERTSAGWSEACPIAPIGYLAWRPRVLDGRPILSLNGGGGAIYAIYTTDPDPTGVEMWTTSDGFDWGPVATT